jgi:hypothetical protein
VPTGKHGSNIGNLLAGGEEVSIDSQVEREVETREHSGLRMLLPEGSATEPV